MSNARVKGWRRIAALLGVSIRTAQRWRKQRGLPVKTHGHGAYAYADAGALEAFRDGLVGR